MVKYMVPHVIAGSMKYGSGKIKSLNQNMPPCIILSTGTLVIPRRPKNIDINIKPWTPSGQMVLNGFIFFSLINVCSSIPNWAAAITKSWKFRHELICLIVNLLNYFQMSLLVSFSVELPAFVAYYSPLQLHSSENIPWEEMSVFSKLSFRQQLQTTTLVLNLHEAFPMHSEYILKTSE